MRRSTVAGEVTDARPLRQRMREAWPLLAAVAAWCGVELATAGHLALSVPTTLIIALVGLVIVPKPWSWCLVLFVATNTWTTRALDGLDKEPEGPFTGEVRLVTDPQPVVGNGLRFEVDTEHGHLLAVARASSATTALETMAAGQRAVITGTLSPIDRPTDWTRSRHLAGRLQVERVEATGAGPPYAAAANAFRDNLLRGASSLDADSRALLGGLVFGERRSHPPELTADFRASGLTHLLVVSGQNVLLVLLVAGVILKRLPLWPRYLFAVSVIAAYAVVSRFEPSVMRASFMAGVTLYAHTTGRPSGGLRHLSVAICLLLLVDPLLVDSLGFRLSAAASLGIIVLAQPIVARTPGPRWFREGFGVTAAAQIGVAPVLVPTLGPMPLASLPANIAAGPLAAALKVWGLTAGTVAGLVGDDIAWLLHRPTALGLDLLEGVATASASAPLGQVDMRHIGVIGAAMALAWWGRRRATTAVALVAVGATFAAAAIAPVPHGAHEAGWDAEVWVDGGIAVVTAGPRANPVDVLDTLRSTQVTAVGLVVIRSARPEALDLVDAIESRFPVGGVIAPPGSDRADAIPATDGLEVHVARFRVIVDQSGPPLRVRIGWQRHDPG